MTEDEVIEILDELRELLEKGSVHEALERIAEISEDLEEDVEEEDEAEGEEEEEDDGDGVDVEEEGVEKTV
jgi:hypothetical protein